MIKEAMEKNEAYGVVLMDVQMPYLDGIQCTRTVRALGYTAPIIALTAYADNSNERECLDAGMNYFLAKPIDRKHLREVLKVCVDVESDGSEAGLTPGAWVTPSDELMPVVFTPMEEKRGFMDRTAEEDRTRVPPAAELLFAGSSSAQKK